MPATRTRAGDLGYLLVAGFVVAFAAAATAHGEWVSDSWIHLGAVQEMSADLWSPVEPLTGQDVTFPYYSPWTFVCALAVRWGGVSPQEVVGAMGVISPVLLVLAVHRFVRTVSSSPWAPFAALVALVTVWGTKVFFWSGFLSLSTLVVGSSWPSALATGLWLLLWAAVWSSARATPALALALLLVPGVLLLIHPFTFISAAVACTLTALSRWERRRWLLAAGLALGSVGLAALWPWTSLPDLLANPRGFDAFHVFFYRDVVPKFGLTLLAVPALALRLSRDRKDPLAWSAVAGVALWLAGGALDVQSLGRVLPLATTAATMSLGIAAAEAVAPSAGSAAGSGLARRGVGAIMVGCWVIAVAMGAWTQTAAWSRVTPDEDARRDPNDGNHIIGPYPDVDALLARVPTGSVVIARQEAVARQLPAHRLRTVAPQWPSPGVRDAPQRAEDQGAIVAVDTEATHRTTLIDRYDVAWVVWPIATRTPEWLARLGTPVAVANRQQLFHLERAATP